MVFRSDPRAGYGKFDFNVEWFYQYLDERQEELVLKRTNEETGTEFTEEELLHRENVFERVLERSVEYWIGYSVFGNTSTRIILYKEVDLSGYESVWEVLYDSMLDFLQTHPDYFTLKAVE
jgi:hypothetical protein